MKANSLAGLGRWLRRAFGGRSSDEEGGSSANTSVPGAAFDRAALDPVLGAAVTANNEFGAALFGALRAEAAGQNFLISPISAWLALGMTYAGARELTRSEMAQALQLGPAAESLFAGQNALRLALAQRGSEAFAFARDGFWGSGPQPSRTDYSLELVHSLWGEASYEWQLPFLNTLAVNYGAALNVRDFKQQSNPTRLEINQWVSANTNHKIKDLLPEEAVKPDTRFLLVNALHIKLPWANEFPISNTRPERFTSSNGQELSLPFMHREDRLAYRDDGSAQIVALPLTSGRLWLIIALPHTGVSLDVYEQSLIGGSTALVVPSTETLVALALPRVTFSSPTFSLREALRRLGMVEAFEPERANLEGMCQVPPGEPPLVIGDVLQKTMIAIQETGIEAAAATAVIAICGSAPQKPLPPLPMIVNRPYLVAIVDKPTGALLMLGHIAAPEE